MKLTIETSDQGILLRCEDHDLKIDDPAALVGHLAVHPPEDLGSLTFAAAGIVAALGIDMSYKARYPVGASVPWPVVPARNTGDGEPQSTTGGQT